MSNFHRENQVKRLAAAIRSKHRAAFLGMLIKAISPITRPIDRFFQLKTSDLSLDVSSARCVFIVCPPRSGGTIIYQALTRALPSVYLSNAHALFPNLAARWFHSAQNQSLVLNSFNNYYGYTGHLMDVYEGNEFFEWAYPPGETDRESNQYLRTEFGRLLRLLSPLPTECVIFKNARAYSIVTKLHLAIPEIVFIRVRRDRGQLIESSVRAFRELGSFHPVPDSLRETEIKDPIEFAAVRIEAIETKLDQQFSHLPLSSQFEIPYEAFCERPYEFINSLAYDFLKFPPGAVRACAALAELKPSRRRKVSEAEHSKIQALIQAGLPQEGTIHDN